MPWACWWSMLGWSLWVAHAGRPSLVAVVAGLLVGCRRSGCAPTISPSPPSRSLEIVRYTFQITEFAGGNQGILGFDDGVARVSPVAGRATASPPSGSAARASCRSCWPSGSFFLLLPRLAALPAEEPVGPRAERRSARTRRRGRRSAKTCSPTSCSRSESRRRWRRSPASSWPSTSPISIPSEFDLNFTFFGYAVLILGGFASYGGVVLGTIVLWSLIEGLAFPPTCR